MQRSGTPHGPVEVPREALALPRGEVELDDLGVLRVRGTDAERFLQGQLSNDLTLLSRERALLAGFHNPQGRAIALLRLLRIEEHDILALLPRELTGTVAQRLGRYILRAKVQVVDDSASWQVRGHLQVQGHPQSDATCVQEMRASSSAAGGLAFKIAAEPERWISVTPARAPIRAGDRAPAERNAWRLLDVAAGLPQVYAKTSELFVAQMLNLDAAEAISFSKGCYTGQEVIARAHYRGRIKRRMQRWRTTAPAVLAPGDAARLADGRALRIVEAAAISDGRCEFLAVAPLAGAADEESATAADPAHHTGGSAEAASHAASADGTALQAEQLPLPYDLPA